MANAQLHMIYILRYLRSMLGKALRARDATYMVNQIGTDLVPGLAEYMSQQEARFASSHRPWSRCLDMEAAKIIAAIACPARKSPPCIMSGVTAYLPLSIRIRNGMGSYFLCVHFTRDEGKRRIRPVVGFIEDAVHHTEYDVTTKPRRMNLVRRKEKAEWYEPGTPDVYYRASTRPDYNVPRLWTLAMATLLGNWLSATRETRSWINQQLDAMTRGPQMPVTRGKKRPLEPTPTTTGEGEEEEARPAKRPRWRETYV
jgi:hypothetical protein